MKHASDSTSLNSPLSGTRAHLPTGFVSSFGSSEAEIPVQSYMQMSHVLVALFLSLVLKRLWQ